MRRFRFFLPVVLALLVTAGCSSGSSASHNPTLPASTTVLGAPTTTEALNVPTSAGSSTTVFKQPTPTTQHVSPTTPNS